MPASRRVREGGVKVHKKDQRVANQYAAAPKILVILSVIFSTAFIWFLMQNPVRIENGWVFPQPVSNPMSEYVFVTRVDGNVFNRISFVFIPQDDIRGVVVAGPYGRIRTASDGTSFIETYYHGIIDLGVRPADEDEFLVNQFVVNVQGEYLVVNESQIRGRMKY